MSNNEFSAENLFHVLWKYRKHIIILGFLAAITSSIVSLMMEEKYLSTVIMYPAAANSLNLSGQNYFPGQEITSFGEDSDAERMLQVLNSSSIKGKIIKTYDLFKHYEIEDDVEFRYTALDKIYNSNINFERTKFGSVKISVYDKSPDTAALIANEIAELYDEKQNQMIQQRAKVAYKKIGEKITTIQNEIKQINDSIKTLSMGKLTRKQIGEVMKEDAMLPVDVSNNEMYNLSVFSSIYDRIKTKNEALIGLEKAYQQAEADANLNISHKFIVEPAYVSERKAKPVRWLIVVISTLTTILFSIVLILVLEKIKQLKSIAS